MIAPFRQGTGADLAQETHAPRVLAPGPARAFLPAPRHDGRVDAHARRAVRRHRVAGRPDAGGGHRCLPARGAARLPVRAGRGGRDAGRHLAVAPRALARARAPGAALALAGDRGRLAALRRGGRVPVLGRVRHALQLHRGRLPDLHARGDGQHPRVVSAGGGAARDRGGRPAARLAGQPRAAAARASGLALANAPRGRGRRHPARRRRRQARDRGRRRARRAGVRPHQRLQRRARAQRPGRLPLRAARELAVLRPLLPHLACGPRRRARRRLAAPRRRAGRDAREFGV